MELQRVKLVLLLEWPDGEQGTRTVSATNLVGTSLYVHESVEDSDLWSVSHKSGYALKTDCVSFNSSLLIAEWLIDKCFWDFDSKCATEYFAEHGEFEGLKAQLKDMR